MIKVSKWRKNIMSNYKKYYPRDYYEKLAMGLTIEERKALGNSIQDKSCHNCANGTCRVVNSEKLKNSEACIGWENNAMIGKQLTLTKKSSVK